MDVKNLDLTILNIVNTWYENIQYGDAPDLFNFDFSQKKFRDRYLQKTGEFLKISKRVETMSFKKICFDLSSNYTVDESLVDEYLEWCFDNYDFFVKKYGSFTLSSCAQFAGEWNKEFLKFDFNNKITLSDLKDVDVHKNVFLSFEKYGIPLCATKLLVEKSASEEKLVEAIIVKLNDLTNSKENLSKLKNMLRVTVENAPYSSEIILHNYEKKLRSLFMYFNSEPWCPKC